MTPSKIKWVTYLRCSKTTVWRKVTKEMGVGLRAGVGFVERQSGRALQRRRLSTDLHEVKRKDTFISERGGWRQRGKAGPGAEGAGGGGPGVRWRRRVQSHVGHRENFCFTS